MKSNNNVLVNVLILIVGIVFIFMQSRENVINAIVIITGLLFVASGVINLIMTFSSRRPDGSGRGIPGTLACVAAVALGLWMALEPSSLVNIIVYIFAGLLILGGAFHIYQLSYGYAPLRFPGWMYIFPTVLIVAGATILFLGAANVVNYIVLITGIAMVIFSVNSFLEYAGSQSHDKVQRRLPDNQ